MITVCVCIVCISETVDEDDDLYDFVEDEENEGDEIYEDLMRTEEQPEIVSRPQMKTMVWAFVWQPASFDYASSSKI